MLGEVFEQFIEASPVSVMLRGLLERVFAEEAINAIFEQYAKSQYTKELLFSDLVELMSLVVCGIYPSVNSAYRAQAKKLKVTRTAVYDKINHVEPQVSAALVRETVTPMSQLIELLGGTEPSQLPGYRLRVIDGNCLAGTDHRLKVLRSVGAVALPGKSLVVLDPQLRLAVNVFPCEDGHAQERSLFDEVLKTVHAGELWIGDRAMCTRKFLWGISQQGADFVIRQHGSLGFEELSPLQSQGAVESGELFEQTVRIQYNQSELVVRRVVLRLKQPTRNGETEIAILSSLESAVAPSDLIARLYRGRRSVEDLFQTVTDNYRPEIPTLGYPQAALFAFCLALISYNLLAVLRAVLASVHGVGKIEAGLSNYYLVQELQGTYRGMMIAIPSIHWQLWAHFSVGQLADVLRDLARRVHLSSFLKQPRSPKKKKDPPICHPHHRHLSTARLLAEANNTP